MEAVAEKPLEHSEQIPSLIQHDHDLVEELNHRLDALCDYSERIASAEGDPELQQVWRDRQRQERANIRQLRDLIASRMDKGEFLNEL